MAEEEYEAAVHMLGAAAAGGIERLWFCSGTELTSLQEAVALLRAKGQPAPRIITALHEHVALTAALGETMVTRRPSMAAAHADLGLLNFGGSLHNALRGRFPVLIVTGYPATAEDQRVSSVFWLQQRWDHGEPARQYTKWDYKLSPLDDPSLIVSRALQVARTAPLGPVHLVLPAETGRHPTSVAHPTTVDHLGVPALGGGDSDQVDDIAKALLDAQQPLVIVDRAGEDPEFPAVLAEVVEEFAIGVTSSRHRVNLSDDHPSRRHGIDIAEADAILVIDTPVPWVPKRDKPAQSAWVAVVGPDPIQTEIPLVEHRADRRLQADPVRFLRQLQESMRRHATSSQREACRARFASWRSIEPRFPELRASGVPETSDIYAALNELIDQDDLVCSEKSVSSGLRRTRGGTLFEKGGSSLGWAMAAAVGARLGSGDKPTVALTTDGAYMFGLPHATLWQQQHCDAPVMTVIANNRGYSTGTATLRRHYPDGYAASAEDYSGAHISPPPNHVEHALSQGAFGVKVTDCSELPKALAEARRAVEVDRVPAVVDVWIPPLVPDKASGGPARKGSTE